MSELILSDNASAPATPNAGQKSVYTLTASSSLFIKDDGGIETEFLSSGGGSFTGNVEVDSLSLADNGGNSQVWLIEEDSASPTNALTFDYNSVERLRITPTGSIQLTGAGSILDANGNEVIIPVATASAVNEITITNAATGNGPEISATGDDTNVDITIKGKGTGDVVLGSNLDSNGFGIKTTGDLILEFTSGGELAVNNLEIVHAVTGTGPIIRSVGTDTNVDLFLNPKGTGNLVFDGLIWPSVDGTTGQSLTTDGSGNLTFATTDASEVPVTPFSDVTATDVQTALEELKSDITAAAGSGIDDIIEDTTPQLGGQLDVNSFAIGNGTEELIAFVETGSAVNEITITNAATAGTPRISSTGDDTNIDLELAAQGLGNVIVSSPLDVGGNGTAMSNLLSATSALDFPSLSDGQEEDLTITVTGAAVGDSVALGMPLAPTAGVVFTAFVSATNTVTVRASNFSGVVVDPTSGTFRATVFQF